MHSYWLIVGALAVWRISHLLSAETGPWQILDRLRRRMSGMLAELVNCIYCTSVWIAAPFAFLIGVSWKERLLLWPALSGAAILLERLAHREPEIPTATYFEDTKEDYVLRKEQDDVWVGRR
jgi:hypothetical protein